MRELATREQALRVACPECSAPPRVWCSVSVRNVRRLREGYVHERRRYAFTRQTGAAPTQLQLAPAPSVRKDPGVEGTMEATDTEIDAELQEAEDEGPMNQEEAFALAKARWSASGQQPAVGRGVLPGHQEITCHVGWKEHAEWRWIGWGATFEEAFQNVRKVKLHYRDKIEVYQ